MPTTSPSAALHSALAAYLTTGLQATAGLADSECLSRWPEPTSNLELSETRIIVAIERAGAPDDGDRIGGPIRTRIDVAGAGTATARYDFGQIEQPFQLGVWAQTDALRDEADEVLHRLLNQPYASTITPLVNTVAAYAITAGTVDVIPASMDDIWPNTRLRVGASGTSEVVIVESTTTTSFRATFQSAHAAGVPVVEVAPIALARAATGLLLRCPLHLNAIGRFDFDQPRIFDNVGDSSERQEWRSIRNGVGSLPQLRSVSVPLQESLTISISGKSRPIF